MFSAELTRLCEITTAVVRTGWFSCWFLTRVTRGMCCGNQIIAASKEEAAPLFAFCNSDIVIPVPLMATTVTVLRRWKLARAAFAWAFLDDGFADGGGRCTHIMGEAAKILHIVNFGSVQQILLSN